MLKARTLAVSNQKGGVGKTTTAINIAACLAAAEYRVLLVDLDPQGNASSALGLETFGLESTSYEMLIGEIDPLECVQKTALAHLDLICANQELIGAEIELVSCVAREQKLKDALACVEGHYDFILIDCPPALGLLTVNALVAAHSVLVPLQCEYLALEGLSHFLRTLELVRSHFNPNLQLEGLLFTLHDFSNPSMKKVMDEVDLHFAGLAFRTVIPRSVKLSEAPSFGLPIVLHDVASSGALAYLDAAQELLLRFKSPARQVTDVSRADNRAGVVHNHDTLDDSSSIEMI